MEWERVELLRLLRLVQPALGKPAAGMLAAAFENIWLTPFGMLACNDIIGMAVVGKEDGPVGGVNGARLIKLLHNFSAKTVTLSNGAGNLVVEAEGFTAALPVDASDPPLVWPQVADGTPMLEVDARFVTACKLAKLIVDPLAGGSVQARGLTLGIDASGLALAATDRNTLMIADIGNHPDMDGGKRPLTVALSLPFVTQLIKLAPGWLTLAKDYCLFETDRVGLLGRYVQLDDPPLDFYASTDGKLPQTMAPLPAGFHKAVARAGTLTARGSKLQLVRLRVGGEKMYLDSTSSSGVVGDVLAFAHPPVEALFSQKEVARAAGDFGFTQLGVTAELLLFESADQKLVYAVATQ